MSNHKQLRVVGLGVLACTGFASFEAHASCGTFGIVKGDVKIESGTTHKLESAVAGGKVCSGDTVISGKDARAKILINADAPSGKNELNISPDTHLIIANYEFNPTDNKKKVMLNILSGKVRATTTPNYYNDKSKDGQANTFEIRTKSAVAGVRGTDFMASFAPETGKSELVTFSGKVTFGQPGPNGTILNAVTVGAGQQSAVSAGKNPITPKAVPSADMKRLDKESKPETATPAANSPNSASGGGSDKKKSDSANSSGSTGSTSDSGSTTGDKKGGATAGTASGATTGTTTGANGSTGDSGDRSPASVGGAGGSGNGNGSGSTGGSMAGPGSGAGSGSGSGSMPGPMPGMVDHSDLGGGAVNTGLPGSIGNVKIPDVSAVAPVTQPTAVTLPKCDFCSQAVQNGSSKVNVIIHLPGK